MDDLDLTLLGTPCRLELLDSRASDLDVINAARVSFDVYHSKMKEGDDKLITYLLRERHGSPFEHTFFKFRVHCPIFVVREHHRHRVGHSYNEVSGRYVELSPEFYFPEMYNVRTRVGKPGAYKYQQIDADSAHAWLEELLESYKKAWRTYQKGLRAGVANEQARMCLPVGIMTKFIWTCNARSLMHYIGLRSAPNAMWEIQQLSNQAQVFLAEAMPLTHAAFVANGNVAP